MGDKTPDREREKGKNEENNVSEERRRGDEPTNLPDSNEGQSQRAEQTARDVNSVQPRPRSAIRQSSFRERGRSQEPPRPPNYYTDTYSYPQQRQGPAMAPMGNPFGQMAFFQNPILDFSYWAPYPTDIPEGSPPGLAHLLSVDSVIIVQQVNLIELFMDVDETCRFMVLNSEGLCIFYAYETSTLCGRCCCGDGRPLQIHVKDLYQNEIIYMNRLCTCNYCCSTCCCLSAMEIYSIPLNPVGAVIQKCYMDRVQFDIVNVDENVMFKIQGPPYCLMSNCCVEAEFTIHALDASRSEVGLIRKQWGGTFREMLSSADLYTVSFPKDLDVKIKAIFLGAMFLINYIYNEND